MRHLPPQHHHAWPAGVAVRRVTRGGEASLAPKSDHQVSLQVQICPNTTDLTLWLFLKQQHSATDEYLIVLLKLIMFKRGF